MRRAAKVDENQKSIVAALRKAGCMVLPLHAVGFGCPDLLVGSRNYLGKPSALILLEIKDGDKPPSARRLTPDQVMFHSDWYGYPVYVVTTVSEALAAAGVRVE